MKHYKDYLTALGKALDSPSVKVAAEKATAAVKKPADDGSTLRATAEWTTGLIGSREDSRAAAKRLGGTLKAGDHVRYATPSAPRSDHYGIVSQIRPDTAGVTIQRHHLADDGTHKAAGIDDHVSMLHVQEIYTNSEFPTPLERVSSYAKAFARWFND